MIQKKYLVTVIALLTSGCTLAPIYHRPEPAISSAYPEGGVYATQPESTSQQKPAVEIGWRDFFKDPYLQALIELALKNNQDLRVAMLNVEAARAQYQISRSQLLPSISAGASRNRSFTPDYQLQPGVPNINNTYNVGLVASWEIDLFGRLQSLKDEALSKYFATAQARKAAEISLVAQVADQYLTILAYDRLLQITNRTLESAQQSYRLAQIQFRSGTTSGLDLAQARTVLESAVANQQQQERMRAQALNSLVLLVGQPLPNDLPKGFSLDSQHLLADIPAGLPSDLLTRRPDVMAAENSLKAANANIGAARAAFFPSISLTGNFGTVSAGLSSLFKPGFGAWSFMPQVNIPIFQGGLNIANLELANTQQKIAVAQYQKAIQQAFKEVADGLAARGTYDQQVKAQRRNVQAQKQTLDLSQLRYKNGVDSYLNVLVAQTSLYASQQGLVQAQLGRLSNLVDLYRALGGGWIEHTGDQPRPADLLPTDRPPEKIIQP